MKGVVFNVFLEMVEDHFSYNMVDDLLLSLDLPSGGSYTSIGTYDVNEMVSLVALLGKRTGTPVPDLLKAFGEFLFGRFTTIYGDKIDGMKDAFDLLRQVDSLIHHEVQKMMPGAELPKIRTMDDGPNRLIVDYQSIRCLGDVAAGLIAGCVAHYGNGIDIQREDLAGDAGSSLRFVLTRH